MSGVLIHGETGRSVNGEWETKPAKFYVHKGSGWITVSKSNRVSAPTIIEVRLSDLLRALADAEDAE